MGNFAYVTSVMLVILLTTAVAFGVIVGISLL